MPRSLRDDARSLLVAALRGGDPARRVAEVLAESPTLARWGGGMATDGAGPATSPLDRPEATDTLLVALGRAAGAMAAGASAVLGGQISAGVVASAGTARRTSLPPQLRLHRVGDPDGGVRPVEVGVDLRALLAGVRGSDRVLVLLSDGADACIAAPRRDLSAEAVRSTVDALVRAGWHPRRVSAARTVLDDVWGGGLARLAAPAATVGVVLGSPPGSDPGGGPVAPLEAPRTSPRDLEIALRRDGLWAEVPTSVRTWLEAHRQAPADPSPTPPVEVLRVEAGDGVATALQNEARTRGYTVQSLGTSLAGDPEALGRALARAASAAQDGAVPVPLPACLVGRGRLDDVRGGGGRGQVTALAAARALAGRTGILVAAVSLSGDDGGGAAGGLADGTSVERAARRGIDLQGDPGAALEQLDDLLVTGPTGVDGGDLHLVLIAPSDGAG